MLPPTNQIEAHVEFSFQGKVYTLTSCIDLDVLCSNSHQLQSIYDILAREHTIDPISYLYEVMLAAEINFSHAKGEAIGFFREGNFNLSGYYQYWQESQIIKLLQPIVTRELNVDDLIQHPNIINALIHAYKLGRGF